MNNNTQELIDRVYQSLDYSLTLSERLELFKEDFTEHDEPNLNDVLVELTDKQAYYASKPSKDYSAFTHKKKIDRCLDAVGNYILFCRGSENNYAFTYEDNYQQLNAYKFKPIGGNRGTETNLKDVKITIQSYLERDDTPEYIYDYLKYIESTRHIIEAVDKQLNIIGDVKDNHIFIYKTLSGKEQSITYEDYKRLKRTTGYTKNNSVNLDKEILSMLMDHYKPMSSNSSSFKNMWTEISKDLDPEKGFDISFLEKKNIDALVKSSCFRGESETMDIYFDRIDDLVSMTDLTDLQTDIYSTLKAGELDEQNAPNKISLIAVAEKLGVNTSSVYKTYDLMIDKIYNTFLKVYEDKYYLYVEKGTYKKCSKCGQVKLATENYFHKDSKCKDGYKNICKECIKFDK